MALKAWTFNTVPKDRPVYVRRKAHLLGASIVNSMSPDGVLIIVADGGGKPSFRQISWNELFLTCEQFDGTPCGTSK